MALLTLFTTPKPFQDSHVITIQRNALKSWKALGDEVEVVFIGDEYGMPEIAREFGLIHRPDVRVNELGTPLISSIFEIGRAENDSPFLAYVNTDIILFPDFLEALKKVATQLSKFLLVGQRYDLDITEELAFEPGWQAELLKKAQTEGKRHARAIENECYVAIAGCVGNLPKVHNMDIQYAQSVVFTPCDFAFPTNGIKAEATPNTEMILIADVDIDLLRELNQFGSVRNLRDRRKDVYNVQVVR